jgi:hypothetical protein
MLPLVAATVSHRSELDRKRDAHLDTKTDRFQRRLHYGCVFHLSSLIRSRIRRLSKVLRMCSVFTLRESRAYERYAAAAYSSWEPAQRKRPARFIREHFARYGVYGPWT